METVRFVSITAPVCATTMVIQTQLVMAASATEMAGLGPIVMSAVDLGTIARMEEPLMALHVTVPALCLGLELTALFALLRPISVLMEER